MPAPRPRLVGPGQFLIGLQAQSEWAWLITAAFLFGTVGAGLYVVSFVLGYRLGALVAFLLVAVGKGTAHMLFLGKPLRFPFAVLRWRTSWISRGVIAMLVFMAGSAVYVTRYVHLTFVPYWLTIALGILGFAAACVIMVYDGFVLRACRGIPFWNSFLMPAITFSYALLGGTTALLVVQTAAGSTVRHRLEWLQLALLLVNLALVATVLTRALATDSAASFSASLLTRGKNARLFLIVGLGIGVGLTLVLVAVSVATGSSAPLVAAAVTDLAGEFFLFFSVLRAGVHPAPRPIAYRISEPTPSAGAAEAPVLAG